MKIRRPATILALATFPILAAAPAQYQKLTSLSRMGSFIVEVDGAQDPKGRVYHSQQPPAFLIRSSLTDSDYVLYPRAYEVVSLDPKLVSEEVDGKVQVAADYSTQPVGQFTVGSERTVSLTADGHTIRLLPKGELLGYHSAQDIYDYDYRYVERARAYQPDAEVIKKLKTSPKKAQLTVYFGSWCPHCQMKVPHMLRVEQELKGTALEFIYYGIPPAPRFAEDPEVKKYNIPHVPVGILRSNGKEVGRIDNVDWDKPEARIAELLQLAK